MEQRDSLETAQATLLAGQVPQAKTGRVRWSGGQTQVLELGNGPPLLLVHGGLGDSFAWAPILPRLAETRRVLAVDLPGHGLADSFSFKGHDLLEVTRTFLGDIVDELHLHDVDIVGSSLGGLFSIDFALGAPGRVSRLVLLGMPGGYKRSVPVPLRMLGLPLIGPPLGRLVMSKPTREGNRKFWGQILVAKPSQLDDALLDADVASQMRNVRSHLSFIRSALDIGGLRRRLLLGPRWEEITVPTLMLWGERDVYGSPEEGQALADRNPHLRLVPVPEAGHLLWIDDADRVVKEIETFLSAT